MSGPRVQFIHGLEGSPMGAKARMFAECFTALTPAMDTRDFEGCVALHAQTLASFGPDVLVGSSFGGAVAVALLQRGLWKGPTVLLAQAALQRGLPPELPAGVRVWIVHAQEDALVPIEDSRRLARAGAPELVRLFEVDDDHGLHRTLAGGRLEELVREICHCERAD